MDLSYNAASIHAPATARQRSVRDDDAQSYTKDNNASILHSAAQQGAAVLGNLGFIAADLVHHPTKLLDLPYTLSIFHDYERLARRIRLLQQLTNVTSWAEYSVISEALDQIEGAEAWKEVDESEFYDVVCLRNRLKRLVTAIERDDVAGMLNLIRGELTRDLGSICSPQLYHQTRTGTKFLIDHYIADVHQVLDRVVNACAVCDPRLDKVDVQVELEQTRKSYGRTALLLSGGGTLGMSHIGVIKALHEADALPRIISGSSSGSIVAAVLGSTTDEDLLPRLHEFCHGDLAVFVGMHETQGWIGRLGHFRKNGRLFDMGNLRRVMVDLLGKTTFLEAYNRTRRILNIAVSTSTHHESQQVLNYATAPNVVIWSAVVASCAVPFGFEPERLLYKRDEDPKNLVPWDPSTRYIDGSINGDLPSDILSAEFDVNHSIVSQVNPHVAPFLKYSADSSGNLGTPYWISTAALLKEEAMRSLVFLSDMPCFERNNNILTKLNSVLGQRYSGDITLFPVDPVARFWTILENPTPQTMEQSTKQGERATWPVLNMIKTHMDIELLIDDAVRKVSEHVSFSQSVSDLRMLHFKASRNNFLSSGGRLRTRRAPRHKSTDAGRRKRYSDHLRLSISSADTGSHATITLPVEGTPHSSSRSSLASSLSNDSDSDEGYGTETRQAPQHMSEIELSLYLDVLNIQTQPSSPVSERRASFFSPERTKAEPSASPPMSLRMTPMTPRAGSPEASYKTSPSSLMQRRRDSRSPPPTRGRASGRGWTKMFSRMPTPARFGRRSRSKGAEEGSR